MTAPSRPPLINRPLVGILAIVGLVSGLGMLAYDSFDSAWAASLIRVGVLLAVFWLWLAPAKGPVAKVPAAASWLTMALAGFALAAIRSRKPVLVFLAGAVFVFVAFVVRPRQRR